ncbi:MAG: DUF1826 domain-containing protein [Pseudomonadota bacterium]
MSAVREKMRDADAVVEVVAARRDLSLICRSDCPAVIWQRRLSANFERWIQELDPARLPSARIMLKPSEAHASIANVFTAADLASAPQGRWLVEDMSALAEDFAAITGAPFMRIRMDVVDTDKCRKFHTDVVTSRLLCTYRGTGTQYAFKVDGAEPERIFTAPTGAAMILRGTLWPEVPASGFVHRSPPIAGTGETRLIFVLDPLDEPEDEA